MGDYEGFFEGKVFYGGVGIHNLLDEMPKESLTASSQMAYHVFLTAPWFYHNPGKPLQLHETILLTARLSALAWRRYNGPICLMTDTAGAKYFKEHQFEEVYNDILPVLDERNFGISPRKYWAAGKIQALARMKSPCVLLDLDLIVWRPIDFRGNQLAVSHLEHISRQFYPELSFFSMGRGYTFPKEWDEKAEPLNTSLVYFGENGFREYYTKESIRFMQYERDTPDDGARCMVFAEQRILGMCAAAKGIRPRHFLDYDDPLEKQSLITHIWSAKRLLQTDKETEERYKKLVTEKIRRLEQMHLA